MVSLQSERGIAKTEIQEDMACFLNPPLWFVKTASVGTFSCVACDVKRRKADRQQGSQCLISAAVVLCSEGACL